VLVSLCEICATPIVPGQLTMPVLICDGENHEAIVHSICAESAIDKSSYE